MKPTRTLVQIAKRVALIDRVRTTVLEEFEVAPGPAYVVRRADVVEHVADKLRLMVNPNLFREVEAVCRRIGWEPIKVQNRRLYRKAKRRAHTEIEALAYSKQARYGTGAARG